MSSDQDGSARSFEERESELQALLEEVGYQLSEARHRSLGDASACTVALDRALRKLADARALAAAEAASR